MRKEAQGHKAALLRRLGNLGGRNRGSGLLSGRRYGRAALSGPVRPRWQEPRVGVAEWPPLRAGPQWAGARPGACSRPVRCAARPAIRPGSSAAATGPRRGRHRGHAGRHSHGLSRPGRGASPSLSGRGPEPGLFRWPSLLARLIPKCQWQRSRWRHTTTLPAAAQPSVYGPAHCRG
jgi:hypothetical protein